MIESILEFWCGFSKPLFTNSKNENLKYLEEIVQ